MANIVKNEILKGAMIETESFIENVCGIDCGVFMPIGVE